MLDWPTGRHISCCVTLASFMSRPRLITAEEKKLQNSSLNYFPQQENLCQVELLPSKKSLFDWQLLATEGEGCMLAITRRQSSYLEYFRLNSRSVCIISVMTVSQCELRRRVLGLSIKVSPTTKKKKKNKKEDVESFSSLTRSLSDTVITA